MDAVLIIPWKVIMFHLWTSPIVYISQVLIKKKKHCNNVQYALNLYGKQRFTKLCIKSPSIPFNSPDSDIITLQYRKYRQASFSKCTMQYSM